jgi:ribosomal protein S18 acetylase RimI-like enzyme
MATYEVRNLCSDDFPALMRLEESIFAADGEDVLGPYYVRLCCDFYNDTCFVVVAQGEPVGYLLSFVRGREAYCTTLAVVPEYQGTRVVHRLLQSFVKAIANRVDACWFTVKQDNDAARAVHAALGATNVSVRQDFYGPGDERIVSCIDRERFEKLRIRYERLGLVDKDGAPESAPQSWVQLAGGDRSDSASVSA